MPRLERETPSGANSGIEVKTSPISGRGVFATKEFQPNDVVLVWDTSHIVDDKDIDSLSEADNHAIARYQGKWIVMQPPLRFVNHSCDSNTRPDGGRDMAVRHVSPGEEITTDYRPVMKKSERMECHCGGASCQGFISGTEE